MLRKFAIPVTVFVWMSFSLIGVLPFCFADLTSAGNPLTPMPSPALVPLPEAMPMQPDGSYILGAGDEISVEDVTMGTITTGQTKILADGTVDLPLIGEISLAGLSLDDAQNLLNQQYKNYYVNPAISIQVIYPHPVRVYVQGAVNNPGVYISGKNTKPSSIEKYELGSSNLHFFFYQFYLTDALIQAGGLKYNANLRDIIIHRTFPTPQTIHVNLWELFKMGATIQDLPLREQDVIQVASLPKDALVNNDDWKLLSRTNVSQNQFTVNVIGAVKQPGSYQISNADNVLQAIAMAGGFSPVADQGKLFVLRTNASGQVFKKRIDASNARLMGKGKPEWIALMPEDVIFVDDSAGKHALSLSRRLVDKATGAAMLPYFNSLLKEE